MHQGSVFVAGLIIAAFVSIPIVNLATPLFGMACTCTNGWRARRCV
jgi:uncharacterized protein involved in cysteine biosynthesis